MVSGNGGSIESSIANEKQTLKSSSRACGGSIENGVA